ncbi:MAG: YIP1 family protein, partial [Terriglobia bacterium]
RLPHSRRNRHALWLWKGRGMSNLDVQPGAGPVKTGAGLTQWERAGNVFVAPAKTFDDIGRGNRSWWLPFLIVLFFTYILFAAITMKIGWKQVAMTAMANNPKSLQRLDQLSPEQRDHAMKVIGVTFMELPLAASPALILLGACLISLLLWGTINFGFGGKATYLEIFAVNMYAILPRAIVPLMATIAIFAGLAPDSFNINNIAATNVAYFLSPQDTGQALYALLSQIDIINIWVAVLLSLGIARVARKERSAGFIGVFGWWAVWVLVRVGMGFAAG